MLKNNFLKQPIDKISFLLITIFSFLIVVLIGGNRVCYQGKCIFDNKPKVVEFSWKNKKIGAKDTAFYLVFDRPMSHESVEKNLKIEPKIDGRISWSGKRLVYTLNQIPSYGKNYYLSLRNAQEKFRGQEKLGDIIEPFMAKFQSRDRAFAYIGSQGEERGRLILNNSTQQIKTILTPEYLTVLDFKFTPNSEKIIFSAINKKDNNSEFKEVNIYQVTTGLSNDLNRTIPSKLTLLLSGKRYQNNKFDLAGENGELIIVQRIKQDNPQDFGLWKIEAGKKPQKLNTKGGDFIITPDGQAVAIAQGEGIAIVPLDKAGDQSVINFLPKYGQVLTFSNDGSSAAMINFNKDNSELQYTSSLVYINNQDVEKELLNIKGSIIDCKFNHTGKQLFCLLTELNETKEELLQERPYFVAIDIQSGQIIPLIALPKYQDIKISMAPDGLGLLFDQLITESDISKQMLENISPRQELLTNSAELIIGSRLWLLKLPSSKLPQAKLDELPINGFKPQWSP